MAERDPHDVVRLTTASNPLEAHMLAQALEAEGISCKVVGDFLDAGIGDIPGVRAEVLIHRDDVAAAEAVLKARRQPSEEVPAGEEEEAPEPDA